MRRDATQTGARGITAATSANTGPNRSPWPPTTVASFSSHDCVPLTAANT